MKTIRARLRPQQLEAYQQFKRFNVMLAHRRFGKTYLGILWLIKEIWDEERNNPRGYYYAPNYAQAKKVAWQYIKNFTQAFEGISYNESELRVNWGDKQIQLGSAENPDSSRGIYADAVILDEPAQMSPKLWSEVLRPALSDREGHALMIGTPQGRHGTFFEAWENAANDHLWARFMFKASETGIVSDDELQANRREMTRSQYLQEFECSFDAAIRGAYWGQSMSELEDAGALTTVQPDDQYQVHCSFDLGMNDATSIWFYQIIGNSYRFFDYIEFTNTGLPDIVKYLRTLGHNYGRMVFPHDVQVRSLSTGQTRKQTLHQLGVDVLVAPNLPIIDGIDTVRSKLKNCVFDSEKCKDGIEALRQYRADYSDKKGVLSLQPVHDWSSHGADAMRYCMVTEISTVAGQWSTEIDYSQMDKGVVSAY